MTRSAVGVAGDSSVDFLAVGVVFVGALGDDGDDATLTRTMTTTMGGDDDEDDDDYEICIYLRMMTRE